jgi:hypothetical protein
MLYLKPEAPGTLLRAVPIVVIAAEANLEPRTLGGRTVARCASRDCGVQLVLEPATQRYHCRGCGEQGNAIGLVMRLHGLPFVPALRFLAERAGLSFDDFLSPDRACGGVFVGSRAPSRKSTVPPWALTPPSSSWEVR